MRGKEPPKSASRLSALYTAITPLMLFYQILFCAISFADSKIPLPDEMLLARPSGSSLPAIPANANIQNTIQAKGTARVIVRLAASPSLPGGFALEAQLNHSEAINQRTRIRQLQNSILSRVTKNRAAAAKRYDFIPFMALEVDQTDLQALISSPEVDFIEEDVVVLPLLAQSVPLIGGVNSAFNGYTGSGQTVAILDTGVEKTHPFLAGKVVTEGCFSTTSASSNAYCSSGSYASGSGLPCSDTTAGCYHGTHVAGIVAGKTGPASAPSGVAKDADLIAVQVFSQFFGSGNCGSYPTCPQAFSSDLTSALQYVYSLKDTYNISSVNMSLGGGQYFSNCDSTFPSFKAAVDNLRLAGIATVIASGNSGYTTSISFPACISSAISVGATDKSDEVASYSNSASLLNLLAPGSSITSSYPGGNYATASGTSMATPHVAGAWAVLKSAKPAATVFEVLTALVNTGKPILDSRNSITKPRIQVDQAIYAIGPTNFVISDSVINGIGGTITSSGSTVPYGGTVTFTITPAMGYTLTGLTDNGVNVTATEEPAGTFTYSISNVTDNHTVIATFAVTSANAVPSLPPFGLSATILIVSVFCFGRLAGIRKNDEENIFGALLSEKEKHICRL